MDAQLGGHGGRNVAEEPALALEPKRRATLRDVARMAGVNPSTVSRVLNDDTAFQVSELVRERILEAAQVLRYQPNRLARGLKSHKTFMLALAVPNMADPFFARMYAGAARAAEAAGYLMVLVDQSGLERLLPKVTAEVDGLLLATARLEDPILQELQDKGMPFVLVNRRSETALGLATVRSDDRLGARLAVEHLLRLGHTRIAHLGGNAAYSTAYDRRAGYLEAMDRAGLPVRAEWLVEAGFTPEDGARGAEKLLELREAVRPTAIFAVNDLTAVGCLAVLGERGIAVPAEISVVGFDDVLVSRYCHPPLTTVMVEAETIGTVAVERLLSGEVSGESVLDVTLRVRGSSGPAPSRPPPG